MSPRDRILLRRAKFMTAAFASAGIVACSDGSAQACLSPLPPVDSGRADTRASDTGTDATDTEPSVCLTAPADSGSEDTSEPTDTRIEDSAIEDSMTVDTGSSKDTGPMPCLTPPPDEP